MDVVANFEIEPYRPENGESPTCDNTADIIDKYKSHPSVKNIKENVDNQIKSPHEFQDEILIVNSKKANVENDIPTKILIGTSDSTSSYLSEIYNTSKNHHDFPSGIEIG